MTLTSSTVSGNSAGTWGGGIYNQSVEPLSITNSTISGNSAGPRGGGGIATNHGKLTLTGSTVTLNTAGIGGGIWNSNGSFDPLLGSVVLMNSTVSDNSAANYGGGILNDGT